MAYEQWLSNGDVKVEVDGSGTIKFTLDTQTIYFNETGVGIGMSPDGRFSVKADTYIGLKVKSNTDFNCIVLRSSANTAGWRDSGEPIKAISFGVAETHLNIYYMDINGNPRRISITGDIIS